MATVISNITLTDPFTDKGRLAFDVYTLGNWDYSAPIAQDREQWEQLGKIYRSLKPLERMSYHEASYWARDCDPYPDIPVDKIEKCSRVLVPFQSPQERKISLGVISGIAEPVTLRTCYDTHLEEAYQELWHASSLINHHRKENYGVLVDTSLYNFGSDWPKILIRIPMLCDAIQCSIPEDYEQQDKEIIEFDDGTPLGAASS